MVLEHLYCNYNWLLLMKHECAGGLWKSQLSCNLLFR